jgi:hypothetical protein
VRLDYTSNQVAVTPRVFPEVRLVRGLAQTLQDDLLRGHRGNTAEVMGGVVVFPQERSVRTRLLGEHGRGTGLTVDLHPRVRIGPVGVAVGGQ